MATCRIDPPPTSQTQREPGRLSTNRALVVDGRLLPGRALSVEPESFGLHGFARPSTADGTGRSPVRRGLPERAPPRVLRAPAFGYPSLPAHRLYATNEKARPPQGQPGRVGHSRRKGKTAGGRAACPPAW